MKPRSPGASDLKTANNTTNTHSILPARAYLALVNTAEYNLMSGTQHSDAAREESRFLRDRVFECMGREQVSILHASQVNNGLQPNA